MSTLTGADKPATPARVTWGEVFPAARPMPPNWSGVGNPMPIPGGALVMVGMHSNRLHRRVTVLMTWNAAKDQIDGLKVSGEPAIYPTTALARDAARAVVEGLRNA